MKSLKVLILLPSYGFDPTEASVPWKYLKEAGFQTVFATPTGKQAQADVRMVTGNDLGIFKSVLMADANGLRAYSELESSHEFQHPIAYENLRSQEYDALLLPGGHDKGMREYLESKVVQSVTADFFDADKPVAAVCHGTLAVGRSISKRSGKPVLWGRKTTGLTRRQELTAYYMTKLYLGDYYMNYSIPMEDELRSYLENPGDFLSGPGKPIPVKRDSPENLKSGFTFLEGNYLSARWPGDAHKFGHDFADILKKFIKSLP